MSGWWRAVLGWLRWRRPYRGTGPCARGVGAGVGMHGCPVELGCKSERERVGMKQLLILGRS